MYIKRICYPVTVLGPGNRACLWVTGCMRNCKGCMSGDLRRKESGRDIPVESIYKMIRSIEGKIDGITISGGEPFLQAEELALLMLKISSEVTKDIIVFSGYTLEELKAQADKNIDFVLSTISVLIDGEYIDELNDGRGMRGSSNQRIHVFKDPKEYEGLESSKRSIQVFREREKMLMVGIQ